MTNHSDSLTSVSSLSGFFKLESSDGIMLMFAAVLAMVLANTPLQSYYDLLISTPLEVRTAVLCGVGFTMSLLIGSLAFDETVVNQLFDQRVGIILGSLVSGIVGYLVLHHCLPVKAVANN